MKFLLRSCISCLLLLTTSLSGQMPALSYQSYVTDEAGEPLAAENPEPYSAIVRIWDAAENGAIRWEEGQPASVFEGRFTLLLGRGNIIPVEDGGVNLRPDFVTLFESGEHYLELTLIAEDGMSRTFSPRQKMTSSATSFRSFITESVLPQGVSGTAWATGSIAPEKIVDASILGSDFALAAVDASHLSNASLVSGDFADDSVLSRHISSGAIAPSKFASQTLSSIKIADNTITGAKVANLSAADVGAKVLNGDVLLPASIPRAKVSDRFRPRTLFPSTQMTPLWSFASRSGEQPVSLNPSAFHLPEDGVAGLILAVTCLRDDSYRVVFPGADGEFPFQLGSNLANSITVDGANQDANGVTYSPQYLTETVHCPVVKDGSVYRTKIYLCRSSGSSAGPWPVDSGSVSLTVIGFY